MADIENKPMEAFLSAETPEGMEEELTQESPAEALPAEETVEGAPPAEAPEQPAAPDQPASSTVPHQALHEERVKRQQLQTDLDDQRRKMDTMNERFAEFTQWVNQRQEPQLNADEDPIAAIKALTERVQGLDQLAGQYRQQSDVQRQMQELNQAVTASHQQFAAEHPDQGEAISHVRNVLAKSAEAQGFSPTDAMAYANRTMNEGAITALANSRDPATALYEQAQALGYAIAQQEPPQAPAVSLEESAAKLKMLQEGQKAAVSLSQGGAQPAASSPQSLEDLADMGEKALDDDVWRRFMGGQSRLDQMMP